MSNDDRYYELETMHGEKGARMAADSHSAAIDRIEAIVQRKRLSVILKGWTVFCLYRRVIQESSTIDEERWKTTQMATILKTGRFLVVASCLAAPFAIVGVISSAQTPNSTAITITLTGQSMIRSDIRETAPAAVPVIRELLKGDVVFTDFEAAVAEKGETAREGRGFLAPPETLDALKTFGFNLLALSCNHAFDLKASGIQNTIREAESRRKG